MHIKTTKARVGYRDHFKKRKELASNQLKKLKPNHLCFALIGFEYEKDEIICEPYFHIRRVSMPPGEIELARALRDKKLLSRVARYSHIVSYELALDKAKFSQGQQAYNFAAWFVSALRIRSGVDFLVPMVANYPWSVIAGVKESSCTVDFLEDNPRMKRYSKKRVISTEDIKWAVRHYGSFNYLVKKAKFRLAVEACATHNQEYSIRMTYASLWTGLEALFSVTPETRFRIATYVAAYLEPRGDKRYALYKRILSLYDKRSDVVHGRKIVSEEKIKEYTLETREVLSRALCKMTEEKSIPTKEEIERLVHS